MRARVLLLFARSVVFGAFRPFCWSFSLTISGKREVILQQLACTFAQRYCCCYFRYHCRRRRHQERSLSLAFRQVPLEIFVRGELHASLPFARASLPFAVQRGMIYNSGLFCAARAMLLPAAPHDQHPRGMARFQRQFALRKVFSPGSCAPIRTGKIACGNQ